MYPTWHEHPINNGLVARFAGDAKLGFREFTDRSAPFRRCTNNGTALYSRDSAKNNEYSFSATSGNSYLRYLNTDSRLKISLPITITGWVKSVGTLADGLMFVVTYNNPISDPWFAYGLDAYGGNLRAVFNNNGTWDPISSSFSVSSMTSWTHIAFTVSASSSHLYTKGGLNATASAGGKNSPLYTSTTTFYLGNSGAANRNILIANVKIWNFQLTPNMLHMDMVSGRQEFPELRQDDTPYYLVGEAVAGATFQPAWASQRTRILSGGVT